MKPQTYKQSTLAISDLKLHPKNYREHPEDQIRHLMASIEQHGIYRNVVVANDHTILAGHGVVKACRQLGVEKIPVIILDIDASSPQALKLLSGDNELGRLAEVDDRMLSELLKEVKEFDTDGLLGTGYDEMMLANLVMVTRPAHEIKDVNHAAEWVGMPDYEPKEKRNGVIVYFETDEDKESFFNLVQQNYTPKTKSIWFPYKEDQDLKNVRYES